MITQKEKLAYNKSENCYLLVKRNIDYDFNRGHLYKDDIILIDTCETLDKQHFIVNFVTSDLRNDKFVLRDGCLLLKEFSEYFEVLEWKKTLIIMLDVL